MKKLVWAILCTILVIGILSPDQVEGAPKNAKQCIEQDANCPELDQSSTNETDSSPLFNDNQSESNSSLFLDIVKLFLALILVLALIYFLLKFMNSKNKAFHKVRTLENLGGVGLGPNKSIQIVRIGDRVFVIGVGENVEMLSEITDESTKDALVNQNDVDTLRPMNVFSSLLSSSKSGAGKNGNKADQDGFQQLLRNELSRLKTGRRKIMDQHKDKDDDTNG
ncbi:flagellar biosynthetic protein FliO [Aquibacillus sp. 3ASR75-11]|uniref:Flagellar biosynthetic protein FliO n=1 Tax=Terrihalobacillus insolitus TaxID=2950438 RepID=A0A9X4AKX3_9BACI|nr:flagellar biosynthetic protein FliO [Terrihalobacillus insolitus]MDC3414125.1 flagellar biosynthetic protein FliO [Terrihalobacillus insolitus]MDC3423566.1 flagellar biosynthetic protein FliO [Terrihalobacillus insolitus]